MIHGCEVRRIRSQVANNMRSHCHCKASKAKDMGTCDTGRLLLKTPEGATLPKERMQSDSLEFRAVSLASSR